MTQHIGRRAVLTSLAGAAALPILGVQPASAAAWQLRWSPTTANGLNAFEGVEDRGSSSHGGTHIYTEGNNFRFTMHTQDRDGSDRQRNEVKGMRQNGSMLTIRNGETWRITYSMYIPATLQATTTFTHIFQTKMPGTGTSPLTVMSLRHVNGTPTVEFKIFGPDILVGRTNLAPLQNKWTDVEIEQKIGDGTAGRVRWVLRSGGNTVIDATKNGDTYLNDVVRPKWGIYRSLGDSAHLRDTYLLLTNFKAYQWV